MKLALADVAQWTEYWPANWKVIGSIPSQATCLDCRSGPQMGTNLCFGHSFSPFYTLSLKKNKSFLKKDDEVEEEVLITLPWVS